MIRATISLANYRHNLQVVRDEVGPNVKILAAVKANAYGHGIVEIAQSAEKWGVEYLGVARLEEVRELRKAGITLPILLLTLTEPADIPEAIELEAILSVHSQRQLEHIMNQQKPATIHIKVDTGMHRAGADIEEVLKIAKQCEASPHITLEGLYTHLAESEDPHQDFTNLQLDRFDETIDLLKQSGIEPPIIHAANSAGIMQYARAHYSMVRPGLMTYGLNPFGPEHDIYEQLNNALRPILQLSSSIAHIRQINPGESVGYNRRWTADRPSTIGLIAGGYGDGWRRAPRNADLVFVAGEKVPIVGSIAMDQFCVDLTDIHAQVGDEVTLIGDGISVRDVASAWGTIDYEVVANLQDRIQRIYND